MMMANTQRDADLDDNTKITVSVLYNPTYSGSGTQADPFFVEDLYISNKKDQAVVETVNPKALIDGTVGKKVFPLAYGMNTITFSVTSSDGEKTVYYKLSLKRNKKSRYESIPSGKTFVAAESAEGAADGRIYGLDAAETYEYWLDGGTRTTVSGVTEITGLKAGTYYIKYGEKEDTQAAADDYATKLTISVRADVEIDGSYEGYTVSVPSAASPNERVDFKIQMNSKEEWVQKVVWKWSYKPSGGWGQSGTLSSFFTGYTEQDGVRCYTGYFIMSDRESSKIDKIALDKITTYTGAYYTIGDEAPETVQVTVTPKNAEDVVLVNGSKQYKKGSSVTITVQANQSFGTAEIEGYQVFNEQGQIIAESKDGKDISVTVSGDLTIKNIRIRTIYADFKKMEEQLARVTGKDLSVYTDNTRVAVEQNLELAKQMYKVTKKDQYLVDEFVEKLKNSIDALTPKAGDFTKANETLAKVPADLDSGIYVEQTAEAVRKAREAVETAVKEGWNRLRQDEIDALTSELAKALGELKKKLADYTKVAEARAKVPSDLSIYTDETVNALQAALAAVESDLDITQQATVDQMAQAIIDAVNGLKKKTADYTKVEAAKAKVPSDLSIYTDVTVNALQAALAAVEPNLDITQQARVDQMAQAIMDAVKGLKEKQRETEQTEQSETEQSETEKQTEEGQTEKETQTSGQNKPSDGNKTAGSAAKTGDETNLVGWTAVLLLSAGSLLLLMRKRMTGK